jgi:transposase
VSVAQWARRHALNANMIFKWLHDARFAPGSAQGAVDAPVFLPVEIVNLHRLGEDVTKVMGDNHLGRCRQPP